MAIPNRKRGLWILGGQASSLCCVVCILSSCCVWDFQLWIRRWPAFQRQETLSHIAITLTLSGVWQLLPSEWNLGKILREGNIWNGPLRLDKSSADWKLKLGNRTEKRERRAYSQCGGKSWHPSQSHLRSWSLLRTIHQSPKKKKKWRWILLVLTPNPFSPISLMTILTFSWAYCLPHTSLELYVIMWPSFDQGYMSGALYATTEKCSQRNSFPSHFLQPTAWNSDVTARALVVRSHQKNENQPW